MERRIVLKVFCLMFGLALQQANGQNTLDAIRFGHPGEEAAHGLMPILSEIYAGQAGTPARRFLPKNPVDYYGGEAVFVMKVDSMNQNYFTARLSGDEYRPDADNGRLVLECEGREVGSRHGGDLEIFVEQSEASICPGAFWYRTVPLPLSLTRGKNKVTIRVRATGRFFAYGKPGNYDSYQRKLLYPTRGLYSAYTHTNPYFTVPASGDKGSFPDYTTAGVSPDQGEQVVVDLEKRCNNKLSDLLRGPDYLKPYGNNNFNLIEYMALAYQIPWTIGYHNPQVVRKVESAIDSNCRRFNEDSTLVGAWGGAYGRLGYAANILYPQLKNSLDSLVDFGKGLMTRRKYWSDLFRASFDFGRFHRRTITNQDLECTMSIYGANLGLSAIDPLHSISSAMAKRYIYEALGMAEWSGDDLPGGGSKWNFGRGYYMMTKKGTSHEPGWVSQDCYGNLGPKIFEIYKMCGNDPSILRRGLQHERVHSYFRYPSTDSNGYKTILTEGVICWRNEYHPGKLYYGNIWLAGESKDSIMLGYIQQMIDDHQFFGAVAHITDVTYSTILFLPEAYERFKAAVKGRPVTIKNPATPGMPDYAVADEENGILAVKHGDEQFFVMLYRKAYAINYLAKAHHITRLDEREIEFIEDDVRFTPSGKYKTVMGAVEDDYSGTPPDGPVNAFSGQQQPIPLLPDGSLPNGSRMIADFYGVHYGNYYIAMNTTKTGLFQWQPAIPVKNAIDLVSGKVFDLSVPLEVRPGNTLVFYLDHLPH